MIRRSVRDVPLVVVALLLATFGIAIVYSAGLSFLGLTVAYFLLAKPMTVIAK